MLKISPFYISIFFQILFTIFTNYMNSESKEPKAGFLFCKIIKVSEEHTNTIDNIIINNDKIFRVSQKNGFNVYGESFSVNEIKVLSKSSFEEVKTLDFYPNFKKNLKGTHHLNNKDNFFVNDFCL